MSTIHLVYSSLEHVFDSLINVFNSNIKRTITLIKRDTKIKQLINDCCYQPTVVSNIIYGYTGEIMNTKTDIRILGCNNYDRLDIDGDDPLYTIMLELKFDGGIIAIWIKFSNNQKIYYRIDTTRSNILKPYDFSDVFYNCDHRFNTFMKKMYNKDNYINCTPLDHKYIIFMKQNSIILMNQNQSHINAVKIKNYRKLTYLIVKLKCIINGIQRYFKTNDVLRYYEEADSISNM